MQNSELFHENKKTTKFQLVNLARMDHLPKLFDIFINYLTIFVRYTDRFWLDLTDLGEN